MKRPLLLLVALPFVLFSVSGVALADTILVAPLSTWKYDTGTDLGTAWTDTLYDDSSWASGPGILGYGDTYIATSVPFGPDPNNKYPTCYFRIDFTYTGDPGSILGFVLRANYDDGFAAYLNGTEVARNLLAPGAPYTVFSTLSHEGGAYETFDILSQVGALHIGNNTLAVEVHQVAGNSTDLVMDVELTVSTTIDVIRGPYLQLGTPSSGIVRWRTGTPTDSRVRYGKVLGVWEGAATDLTSTTEHEIAVTGLLPDTKYFYDVGTTTETLAGGTVDHFFKTFPNSGIGKDTRVWLIGDSGTATAEADAVRSAYAQYTGSRGTDLWIMLGDNAYDIGTDSQYQGAVFDMYPKMLGQCFLWPTRGNHDVLHAGPSNDYYEIFTLPTAGEAGGLSSGSEAYYSFDYGHAHFICLDSEGSDRSTTGAMLTWLANDLAATQQYWIIAYWHHPPYTKGSHDSDNTADSGGRLRDMRENALPILEAGGVDLVFCGHSHSYERSFLLDAHYDVSSTLAPGMIVDGGDGQITGDGAYAKPTWGQGPHEGAVYVVAGSSGHISGGTLNHPVMVHASLNLLGSVVLDIDDAELHAAFIDDGGIEQDEFTIRKGIVTSAPVPPRTVPSPLTLSAGFPNPFTSETRLAFSLPKDGLVRLAVYDVQGRWVRTLIDSKIPEGEHDVSWTGTDRGGRPVAQGIYFAILDFAGERRVRKLTVTR